MAPVPLEGHQTPVTNMPQEGNRGGSISLGLLIDFIIQRTYHELTVLAELLPRKTDMERKIEIYNFSARTRQLFVRLLALVKWASSATKVEKSAHIMAFLDKQSLLFVDTADILARMARETLVHARLPNFHLPAAVEVLTTGSYNRLPACIREKIVPPDPITVSEKKSTLQRLNQVIQHRLVTGNLLPQMKNLEIEAGRVTFRVEQEFSVSLTVMGDGPNVPWRLLDLEILVSDRETGDGKSLVHPMQTQYIHQLVQERLVDTLDPLSEVYHTLHYFCQSLQLEVLYSQTLRLIRDRLDDHIRIDRYTPGECLTISYWKELTNKDSGSELGYKLSVLVDQHDPAKPLAIVHTPSLANKELEISDVAIRSSQLSMEFLLVHTIYIRTRNRLSDLKQELQAMFKGIECTLAGSPAILSVPVLQPCLRAELLLIAVDTHSGMLLCHIPQYEAPLVPELTAALNEDHSRLPALISELRFWITQKRCEKTLQHLPATPHERLPLIYPPDHPIAGVGKHRIYVQFHRHPGVILVVAFRESETAPCEIQCSFYLCAVRPDSDLAGSNTSAHDDGTDSKSHNMHQHLGHHHQSPHHQLMHQQQQQPQQQQQHQQQPQHHQPQQQQHHYNAYLRLESLIEFDTFVVTHGSFTSIDCAETELTAGSEASVGTGSVSEVGGNGERATGKKRRSAGLTTRPNEAVGSSGSGGKRPKSPAYFIPELAHVVALCDEQVPFVMLAQELSKREIAHQGVQIEANAAALVLKLVQLPAPTASLASPAAWAALLKRLLSVALRVQGRGSGKSWLVEFLFYGSPLLSSHPKEQGLRRPVYFPYDMGPSDSTSQLVSSLLSDWAQIVNLFALVHDLAEQQAAGLRNLYSVKSYNYSRLVLAYGPHRRATATVLWDPSAQAFRLFFGKSPASTTDNAHALLKEQLEAALNRERSLAQLIHVLAETLQPLTSVCKLPILLQLGLCEKKAQIPAQTFIVMPQCVTLMRIAYQNIYCLELCFRGAGLVSLRDGAYSRFDHSNVVEGFTPIQGLSTFLSQYVDKSAIYRRRSQSEDDNPPSPVTVGDSGGAGGSGADGSNGASGPGSAASMGFMGPRGPQSPAAQQRFHPPPLTPPSGSNPNTPASPHMAGQQQSGPGSSQHPYGNSPGMSLNLSSPPSLTPNTPNVLPHPSPGSGLVASPLMHAPSPAGLMPTSSPGPCASQVGHSPAGSFMQTGPHGLDGSPFPSSQSMASPAASNWAGSPSISRPSPVRPGQSPGHVPLHSPQQPMGQQQSGGCVPSVSRVLPQRSWAGAIPTLLTCETLDLLCSASKHPSGLPGPDLSPLERFLGCVYMRRQLQRFIQSHENLVTLGSIEPGVIHFKADTLQCRVSLNLQHMQSLHMKLQPLPEHNKQWNLEELQLLERFFEQRVVAPPYKPNSLLAFVNLLNLPLNVLKDFVQIMRLELVPGLLQQQQQCKWSVQYCLRAPPTAMPVVQIGLPGIMQHKLKILFFLTLTRLGIPCRDDEEPPSLVLPFIYDARTNMTSLANERDTAPGSALATVIHQLKRFAEYHAANGQQECSVFPAVRNLLLNLTLPSEAVALGVPSPMQGPQQVVPPGQPQMTGPPGMQQMMPGAQGPPQGPPYRTQPMPPMNMMGGPQ